MLKIILLVEDNPDDEELTLLAFKKCNVANEVVVVRDGEEALDYVFGTGSYAGRDTGVMPEFVLLDVRLPKMDGLQVLKRLREDERTELLPVILFSSSKEHVVKGYTLGANSYVTKPANFDKFSEAMQYLG